MFDYCGIFHKIYNVWYATRSQLIVALRYERNVLYYDETSLIVSRIVVRVLSLFLRCTSFY